MMGVVIIGITRGKGVRKRRLTEIAKALGRVGAM